MLQLKVGENEGFAMNPFGCIKNEKGMALIVVYLATLLISTLAGTAYFRTYLETRQIQREIAQLQGYYAAEAGIQSAMVQIGNNAYTGFINENDFTLNSFQSADGSLAIGTVSVDISYPSKADWVVIYSEATVDGKKIRLEGRIFLDSNLSKYMMYSPAATHGLGGNLQIGFADTSGGSSGEGVPGYEGDRNLMYYTGNLGLYGNNISIYGDLHIQGVLDGNN